VWDDDKDSLERFHGVGLSGLAVHAAGDLEAEGLFHEVPWSEAQGPTGEGIMRPYRGNIHVEHQWLGHGPGGLSPVGITKNKLDTSAVALDPEIPMPISSIAWRMIPDKFSKVNCRPGSIPERRSAGRKKKREYNRDGKHSVQPASSAPSQNRK
jgi:hypothetical protein